MIGGGLFAGKPAKRPLSAQDQPLAPGASMFSGRTH